MDVYVALHKDGSVKAIYSTGQRLVAKQATETPNVLRVVVDGPEYGVTKLPKEVIS